ncbi:3-ketoacyl-CoA reductase [Sistotremastrum suecicum HHB10207 ss-3]|uniref:Very-long-chain 3-oxoacyl-CoA reductase n=1 Tax=Sistotremastrum suecicum HHB10207 ss-3 TaxID=1314776 RepID=A0A166C0Z2_9AGAM|nr:3-ketoacyl-CoA reductase [Sistotremastrum suecicum HHB10207 ss-3]
MAPAQASLVFSKIALLFAFKYPIYTLFCALLGLYVSVRFILRFTRFILDTFVLPGTSLKKYGAGKGAWALITGATDGIGREFALQLAKAGFNILIVSRSADKLALVSSEIETKYGVQVKSQAIDFARPTEEDYTSLASLIAPLPVSVLVNNVGKSHALPTPFVDIDPQEITDIIRINIDATMRVTQIVVPGMIQRKKGLILSLGSFASLIPTPLLTPYSASKAFLRTFTAALSSELAPHGIRVHLLNTYYVTTPMSKIRHPSPLIPTPHSYVQSALSKIGLRGGAVGSGRGGEGTPFWTHSVLDFLISNLGGDWFVGYVKSTNEEIRKRALRKREREAAKEKEGKNE